MMLLELCLLALPTGTVTVTLPTEARVSGMEIRLGDIATISGADPVQVALVEAVELGYVPAPGYSRLFGREYLVRDVHARIESVEVVFAGAAQCRVYPRTELVRAADLRARCETATTSLRT